MVYHETTSTKTSLDGEPRPKRSQLNMGDMTSVIDSNVCCACLGSYTKMMLEQEGSGSNVNVRDGYMKNVWKIVNLILVET